MLATMARHLAPPDVSTYRPPPDQPCPSGLFLYRGAPRVRRAGLVFNVRRLTCTEGHNVQMHGRTIMGR